MRTALVLCVTLILAACGDAGSPEAREGATPDLADNGTVITEPTGHATVTPMNDPGEFAAATAMADLFEIESSNLAFSKAVNPNIRLLAKELVAVHTAAAADLMAKMAVAAPGVPVPTTLDGPHRAMLSTLQRSRRGAEFETAYLDQQTDVHKTAIKRLRDYADRGAIPALKAMAAANLPMIEAHLKTIRMLDKQGADESTGT